MRKIIYAFVLLAISSISIIVCAQSKIIKGNNKDSKEQKKHE